MTAFPHVRSLTGAAYQAAKSKALRGGYTPAPPVAAEPPPIPLGNMTPEEHAAYVAARPKAVRDMTDAEYAVARRAAVKATR